MVKFPPAAQSINDFYPNRPRNGIVTRTRNPLPYTPKLTKLTLLVLKLEYCREKRQYRGCWNTGSLRRPRINSLGTEYVGQTPRSLEKITTLIVHPF